MKFYISLSLKHWRLWGLITLCWPTYDEGDYWKEVIRKPEDGGTTGKRTLEELRELMDKNEKKEQAERVTK